MVAKDFRQSAWQSLKGKWGNFVVATLILSVIAAACSGGSTIGIGAIVGIIIMGPLTLGYSKMGLNVARGEDIELGTLFNGFNDFSRSLVLYITNDILIALWSILLIIPGIIKTFSYSMSYYILLDNPNLTANEARKQSMAMMKGNKWRLFCLEFSFIGWYLLSILTLGILMFWVSPYMETARAKFYLSLLPEEEQRDSAVNNEYSEYVDMSNVDLDSDNDFGGNDRDAFESNDEFSKNEFKEDFSDGSDEFR